MPTTGEPDWVGDSAVMTSTVVCARSRMTSKDTTSPTSCFWIPLRTASSSGVGTPSTETTRSPGRSLSCAGPPMVTE